MENGTKGNLEGGERKECWARYSDLILRIMALVLTLVAAIVVAIDKQTKIIPVTLVESLPPLHIPVTAKWHYLSAFVFFVVSNAIACSYATMSLVHSTILSKGGKSGIRSMIIIVLDLMMVALLFSSNGAASAVGLLGYEGNSHMRWNKVCNVFGTFCNHVAVALVLSLLGSLAFFLSVGLAVLNLHKNVT